MKKSVSISWPAAFDDKSWAQVVLFASYSGGSGLGLVSSFSGIPYVEKSLSVNQLDSSICACLNSLECSLELLADQMSAETNSNVNMVLDDPPIFPVILFLIVDNTVLDLGLILARLD
ncbi:hypothetical protein G9A89_021799 [Geosiphon pyriformis]|nr:hypothetical protein G9A89_021799 [Geosiphon pyriformis]